MARASGWPYSLAQVVAALVGVLRVPGLMSVLMRF
jgi:hypothetical protein